MHSQTFNIEWFFLQVLSYLPAHASQHFGMEVLFAHRRRHEITIDVLKQTICLLLYKIYLTYNTLIVL